MDKKELKFYEAPACEVVKLEVRQHLLDGSTSTDGGVETPIVEDE